MYFFVTLMQLVWIETPTNPTLKVVDITKVTEVVRKYSKDIIIAVDNTFLSAYFQVRFISKSQKRIFVVFSDGFKIDNAALMQLVWIETNNHTLKVVYPRRLILVAVAGA